MAVITGDPTNATGGHPAVNPPVVKPPAPPKPPATPWHKRTADEWMNLFKNTAQYKAWEISANSRRGTAAQIRKDAIKRLAFQYGGLPPGFVDTYGDISAEDRASWANNQYSTSAEIARTDAAGREALHRSLAARGMLQSGDLGAGEDQANIALGQAQYGAGTQFGTDVTGADTNYSDTIGGIGAEEAPLLTAIAPGVEAANPETPDPNAPVAGGGAGAGTGAAGTSFKWGGQSFATKAGWEAYAKKNGINLKKWYANHPGVATAFGVK